MVDARSAPQEGTDLTASGNRSAGNPNPGTAAIVGVFAAVCPPVTCLAYLGLVALFEMAAQRFPSLQYREVVWFVLLYGIVLGSFILVWPAAFMGYLIGRLQTRQGRVRWWVALTFGVVTGAILQLIFLGCLPAEATRALCRDGN